MTLITPTDARRPKPRKGYYKYGYYWGPNYSAGRDIASVNFRTYPNAPIPIDWNDRSAAQHDAAYADEMLSGHYWYGNKNLENADYKFASRGLRAAFHSKDKKWSTKVNDAARGFAGAAAVGAQGLSRRFYRFTHPSQNKLFR